MTVQLENLNAPGYHECRGLTNPSYKFRPEVSLQDPSTLFNTVLMAGVIIMNETGAGIQLQPAESLLTRSIYSDRAATNIL